MSAIKAIYAGIRAVGITEEDDRRDLFERVTGHRRLRAMTPKDKEAVVTELRRLGFRSVTKRRRLTGPYAKKLQALWISAWNLGLVKNREDGALLAFVRRQTGFEDTRFLQSPADADRAIEALKSWVAREGGVIWSNADIPRWLKVPGAKIAWAQWAKLQGEYTSVSTDDFQAAIFTEIGARSTLQHLTSADWRAVMNNFGARIRSARSQVLRSEQVEADAK